MSFEEKLEELERRNQLLEAEIERLRVYKDYAYTDALTEVPNRRFYYERLLQEIARARRGNHALTLALRHVASAVRATPAMANGSTVPPPIVGDGPSMQKLKATIRVVTCALLGLHIGRFRDRVACPTASLTTFEFGDRGPMLVRIGDTRHLA